MGAEKSLWTHFIPTIPIHPLSAVPKRSAFLHWLTRPWVMRRFLLLALASSGLPVSYASSNPSVAVVVGNYVTVLGPGPRPLRLCKWGMTVITRITRQSGPSTPFLRVKDDQFITFEPIPEKVRDDPAFQLVASAVSTGINHPVFTLPVTFTVDYGPASVDAAGVLVLDGMEGSVSITTQSGSACIKWLPRSLLIVEGYLKTEAGNSFSGSGYRWFAIDPSWTSPVGAPRRIGHEWPASSNYQFGSRYRSGFQG